jgi:hypothetical protein
MRMTTRFGTSVAGRAKQGQFGAMQGEQNCKAPDDQFKSWSSKHEVIQEGTSSSSRLP